MSFAEMKNVIVSQFGISPDNFEGNIALSRFFKIVTTCLDGNRKVLLCSWEPIQI